ncbi:MAG: UMP kinase [Methermicoccaceae archaeon]
MKVVVSIGGSILNGHGMYRAYADVLRPLASEHELFVVVGGGALARQYIQQARSFGATEGTCDEIGIAATRLNAMVLIAALGSVAYPSPPLTYAGAQRASLTGRVVVMGGVSAGYTTDAVAAILADYVGANMLVCLTATDGVYTKDPERYEDAVPISTLTPEQLVALVSELGMEAGAKSPFDLVAAKVVQRSHMRLVIASGRSPENLIKAIRGEPCGTIVVGDR